MATNQEKLLLLRVQLFTAMQQLTGQDLEEFWNLIDEVRSCREAFQP